MSAIFNETFEHHRSRLLGLAYRMTGSRSEAEDIVNEAFLKWLDADEGSIEHPAAWLTRVATRLSLDHLKRARVQREQYIGPWLPEPFIAAREEPANQHELDESLTVALMVLLESLSPAERASFILHDLFSYSFDEVGAILDQPAPTCRKQASRARNKIQKDAPQYLPDRDEFVQMATAFFGAIKKGEMEGLVSLLRENVIFHADSDGKAPAAREVLEGSAAVARFLVRAVSPLFADVEKHSVEIRCIWFNGVPGFVVWDHGAPVSAFNFVFDEGGVSRIYVHRNPEKLRVFAGLVEEACIDLFQS